MFIIIIIINQQISQLLVKSLPSCDVINVFSQKVFKLMEGFDHHNISGALNFHHYHYYLNFKLTAMWLADL